MSYTIYLKKNEEKRLLAGHSWVYANEVARIEGKDKNGALACVCAHDGRFLGKGYLNHASKILVRLFIRGKEEDGEALYKERISAAWEYRQKLGYENCCRVVFAEADNLPALIVDKYADVLVVQCLSLGIHQRKEMIVKVLAEIFSPRGIYERSDVSVRAKEGLPPEKGTLYGEVPDEVVVEENGLKMSVDVKNGQKTGYFLDQKENRFALRRYAAGGSVLDCFCNSGGFSLNAALTAERMKELAEKGCYEVTAAEHRALEEDFFAAFASEDDTVEAMYEIFEEYGYPMDTHTGVAMHAANFFREKRDEKDGTPVVVLSTANPYKFPQDVLYALSGNDVKDSFKGVKRLNLLTAMKPPKCLLELRYKPVRFKQTLPADEKKMCAEIVRFAGGEIAPVPPEPKK